MPDIWIPEDGGGRLALVGRVVERLVLDRRIELVLDGGVTVTIETPLQVSSPHGRLEADPEALSAEGVLAVHRLLRGTIARAAVVGQRLEIVFTDGVVLAVPPHPDFEAWQVSTGSGERLIAVPSADLAHWPAL